MLTFKVNDHINNKMKWHYMRIWELSMKIICKSVKCSWNVCFCFSELPETMCLSFDCGAQIKLGFAAEFSNVLVIYTHIIKKPEEMSFCQAHVTDFSQVSVSS